MTFSLDEATAARLNQTSERLRMAKSEVVREAIQDYAARVGRLSERERLRQLRVFDEFVPEIPGRTAQEVDRELEEIRRARRGGGRSGTSESSWP